MEKAVSRRKKVEGFQERDNLSNQNPQSIFREYGNKHSLNIQNAGNITNAVRHGMHGIHFSATERLERKRLVS